MNISELKRTEDRLQAGSRFILSEDVSAVFTVGDGLLTINDAENKEELSLTIPELKKLHEFLDRLLKDDE